MATSTISIALLALGSAAATGAEDAAARGGPVHDGGHWGGEGLPRRGPAHAVPHRLREADASAAGASTPPVIVVTRAGSGEVNGAYAPQDPRRIPAGFTATCDEMGWDDDSMWRRLSDQRTSWWEHANGSYIYMNRGDGKWWIDGPSGAGLYIAPAAARHTSASLPPGAGYVALPGAKLPLPAVSAQNQKDDL